MSTVSGDGVVVDRVVLSERARDALGDLAQSAKEGLLALGVGVALGVMEQLLEEEVCELAGPKGKHDRERVAVRHGYERGAVTLGARRVAVRRPRVRSADGRRELPLASYEQFAARDPLAETVIEQLLEGVSTRAFKRTREPVGSQVTERERSVSKSAVSRQFVSRTREGLIDLMSRRLDDMRLAVLMIDGVDFRGRCCVVALGIDTEGFKTALGLWDGSTENATVATELLTNLRDRGLDLSHGALCVIDGAKALRKAIRDVLGDVPVQRCVRHKERNVLAHLPEHHLQAARDRMRFAWASLDRHDARRQLETLASEFDHMHPGAARSLREGLEETLTVIGLGITGPLKRTLQSTNPCESMISTIRDTSRNVTHWQSGEMCLRWTAAGMLQAERQFQRLTGYRHLAQLAITIERQLATA